eukprot:GHRR01008213.1.p2 GENE.GHRR01008213.1~~GHRR01008213.1.p2  ORF type:complete len:332 (+),score=103.32 GHRR01008213.1:244-1239(+)
MQAAATMRTPLAACFLLLCVGCSSGINIGASGRAFMKRSVSQRYTDEAEADRVTALPGAPELDFGLFSGYVTVDEAAGRALSYIFAESRAGKSHAPLVLWLNGGPGCSSFGGGFMSELGPFYPRADGKTLQGNPYSWNAMANVLWLESPAFVGFSYSNTSSDAIVGDARTAADARIFLLGWLKRFPQYAHNGFYISGESYGGHYVPNLAWEIVQGNKRADKQAKAAQAAGAAVAAAVSPGKGYINLKGFFVGNAWTDPEIDNKGWLLQFAMAPEQQSAQHTSCCSCATNTAPGRCQAGCSMTASQPVGMPWLQQLLLVGLQLSAAGYVIQV